MNKRVSTAVVVILFGSFLFACQSAQADTPTATPSVLSTSTPTMTLMPLPSATSTQFSTTNPKSHTVGTPLENMDLLPTLVGWDY
jgi:hypothetical protein